MKNATTASRRHTLPGLNAHLYFLTSFIVIMAMLTVTAQQAYAGPEATLDFGQGYDQVGFSYALVPVRQGEADIDGGGSLSSTHAQLRLGIMKPVNGVMIGANLSYNHIDYDFTNPNAFSGQAPWDKIRSIDFGVPVLGRLSEKWTYMVVPSAGIYGEYDAKTGDSRTYGIVLAAGYNVEPQRKIGIGLGAFNRLDKSKLFPFVSINWKLNDRWRLSNPLRAGPTGASGLELSYRMSDKLEGGIGFARRNFRFRLDEDGIAPGGIGIQTGRLFFARLTRELGKQMRFGVYLGAIRKGNLEQRNLNEALIGSAEHETAPMLALSIDGRF